MSNTIIVRPMLSCVLSGMLALMFGSIFAPAPAQAAPAPGTVSGALPAQPAPGKPDPYEKLFRQGMNALHGDQLFSAIAAFQELLDNAPGLNRARLELAVAYDRTLQYGKARREARRVLEDPHVPPAVRVSILAFLAQVNEDEKQMQVSNSFKPFVSVGAMYDSNVNFGPASDVIPLGGGALATVQPGSLAKSSSAVVLSAGVIQTYRPGRSFRAGQQAGQFLWQNEFDAYQRSYLQHPGYNLSVASASTGPAWVVLRHWRASVPLQLQFIGLGGGPLALFTSLNPQVIWQLPKAEVSLGASLSNRHYTNDRPSVDGGDGGYAGFYKRVSVSYARYFDARKVALQGEVEWYNFSAHESQFAYRGPGAYLAAFVRVWRGATVFGRLYYNHLKYGGPASFVGVVRDDQERQAVVGVEHQFTTGGLQKWALKATYRFTKNSSNDAVYSYLRRQVSLTLSRNF